MRRRELSAALLVALAAGPIAARVNVLPQTVQATLAPLQRWGTGTFRRFGFLVYEATLWAGASDPLRPPLALGLTYKRSINGKAIAEASADQMRRFGRSDAELARWLAQMELLFPDVKDGDQLIGVQLPDRAQFYFNGQPIGEVAGADFAQNFFAIWLDQRTSEPSLREALLKRAG